MNKIDIPKLSYDTGPETILDILLEKRLTIKMHIEIAGTYHCTANLSRKGNDATISKLISTGLRFAADKMGLMESHGEYIARVDKELRERYMAVDRGNPIDFSPSQPGPSYPTQGMDPK